MTQQLTWLRVFISSPEDVEADRIIAREIIEDMNRTNAHARGIHLEAIDWHNSVYPNQGPDPQAVVNQQIGDDYEIFVGILGSRFGTPTPRSGSGTQEEFEAAKERFNENPASMRVLMYFRTGDVDLAKIDPTQLSQVLAFKKAVGTTGIYHEYKSTEEFTSAFRWHLATVVNEWGDKWGTPSHLAVPVVDRDDEPSDEEEVGFLDLVELGTDSFQRSNDIAVRMKDAIEQLGEDMRGRSRDLDDMGSPQDRAGLNRAKGIVNRAGLDMMQFVKRMDEDIPAFASAYSSAMDSYSKAVALLPMFGGDSQSQLADARETVTRMETSLVGTIESVKSLRNTVAPFPPVTTIFAQGKRKTLSALDRLISEFEGALAQTREAESLLNSLNDAETGADQ